MQLYKQQIQQPGDVINLECHPTWRSHCNGTTSHKPRYGVYTEMMEREDGIKKLINYINCFLCECLLQTHNILLRFKISYSQHFFLFQILEYLFTLFKRAKRVLCFSWMFFFILINCLIKVLRVFSVFKDVLF